jgi:hypothetical protein
VGPPKLGCCVQSCSGSLIEDVRALRTMTGTRSGGRCAGPAGTGPDYVRVVLLTTIVDWGTT